MNDDEKPLLERYRIVIGLLWTQTENLDTMARSMTVLLKMVPDRRRNRQFKQEIQERINATIAGSILLRQGIQELGTSAQGEE